VHTIINFIKFSRLVWFCASALLSRDYVRRDKLIAKVLTTWKFALKVLNFSQIDFLKIGIFSFENKRKIFSKIKIVIFENL
jgi:hypothetical protein